MVDELDLSALRNLKNVIGGDPHDLRDLVNDFVADLPVQLQGMRDHCSAGDLKSLRIAAHSCKSNARDLGALRLSQLCTQLEAECVAGNATDLPALLEQIASAAETALANYAKLEVADV